MSWSLDYFETGDQLCRPTMVCCCSKLSVLSVRIGFFRILTRNLRKKVERVAVPTVVARCISLRMSENLGVDHQECRIR
jgi:hypothetical protein